MGWARTLLCGFIVLVCICGVHQRAAARAAADDGQQLLTVDHYVKVQSKVPAIAGQTTQIYVRERVKAGNGLRGPQSSDSVVLFIHGAGTPAEVAFDAPYEDYSWMAYLANAGFDAFSMDTTGYGRSTRPALMNDPCNLSEQQQKLFIPRLLAAPCAPTYAHSATTIASDWEDIGAVVDYIRGIRRVDRVNLIAWSQGGPRSGGYTALHPEKVRRLVLLAPAYNPTGPAAAPAASAQATAFNTQSHAEFVANWDRQVGCSDQYVQTASDAVWAAMLASDPVGATWGDGVRRAPNTATWGWNSATVAKTTTPTLMVSGIHDKQVAPDRVRQLHTDLGSTEKVFIDLGCSSHNAMWEKNHLLLFRASLEWLTAGSVNGSKSGILKMGY